MAPLPDTTDRQETILLNAWPLASRYLGEMGPGVTLAKVRAGETRIFEGAYLPRKQWGVENAAFPGVTDDPHTTKRAKTYDPTTEYLVVVIEADSGQGVLMSHPIGGADGLVASFMQHLHDTGTNLGPRPPLLHEQRDSLDAEPTPRVQRRGKGTRRGRKGKNGT